MFMAWYSLTFLNNNAHATGVLWEINPMFLCVTGKNEDREKNRTTTGISPTLVNQLRIMHDLKQEGMGKNWDLTVLIDWQVCNGPPTLTYVLMWQIFKSFDPWLKRAKTRLQLMKRRKIVHWGQIFPIDRKHEGPINLKQDWNQSEVPTETKWWRIHWSWTQIEKGTGMENKRRGPKQRRTKEGNLN